MNKKRTSEKKDSKEVAIAAVKKKLIGKKLSYEEILAIMDQIGSERFGPILTTYFTAAGFKEGFTYEELYYLTKAMVDTGPRMKYRGIIADKHSTGGIVGSRTTMILVPIVAAAGLTIPKNSSRAITSPAGTADAMEVLSKVSFSPEQIKKIVHKVGGCIVWGGYLGLAPADDVMIEIEQPLAFESYDKATVSIMAKQVASGATHVILDIPVGPTLKVHHYKDAEIISKKFSYLAKKFQINTVIDVNEMRQNAGRGVGPLLEARDVLSVLEQEPERPLALENKALRLSGKLINLCFKDMKGKKNLDGEEVAREMLSSGKAHKKMLEIIKAQKGDHNIASSHLKPGREKFYIRSLQKGRIVAINNQQISILCRVLGCPTDKKSGMYLNRKLEDQVDKGDILCTLYTTDKWRLKEALETLKYMPVYTVK